MDVMQKKLLVLGGTSASLDVVRVAKSMGVYTLVADDLPGGVSKTIADRAVQISTVDFPALKKLIEDEGIDGAFCGPSEFNLRNCMRLCGEAGLPFYCTRAQWDVCSNKESFKQLCRRHGVPCVPDYEIEGDIGTADLSRVRYPVIVKPVDGCSSKGISVCHGDGELRSAYACALQYSDAGRALVERYIQNDGIGISVRYIACDGEMYLSMVGDRYVVDARTRKSLISAAAFFPSKYTRKYIEEIDPRAKAMFRALGIRNGTLFMQALIENDQIYFHEMGLRLSGGLTYKMTEPLCGVNDVKMMIRHALGGVMCTDEEKGRISPWLGGRCAGSLCVPLKCGTISRIQGVEEISSLSGVTDFTQYYHEGDAIGQEKIGTLMQHFGRLKMITENKRQVIDIIDRVNRTLMILDEHGEDMIYRRFDPSAL